MKAAHVVEEPNGTNMFTNLHQPHHLHHHHHHHHHQLNREYHNHTSEEEESRSSGGVGSGRVPESTAKKSKKSELATPNNSASGGVVGDGATIEVVRRPRGRPPGSKNKPKPPIIITRENESAMRPHVLEVPSGLDIVEAIANFARKQNFGLCVLTASGSISNVSLRQPSTTPGPTVTFHGRYDILSISATYLPPSDSSSQPLINGFTISLAGPQGQIFGGYVVGSLIASGIVSVVATSFTTPSYHRLPLPIEEVEEEEGHPPNLQMVASTVGAESHPAQTESCGMSMSIYSGHLSSDVIWAPTARQPPPPPPPF